MISEIVTELFFSKVASSILVNKVFLFYQVKGFQVAPAELESVLKEHSDVLDVAVVGVPDSKTGEIPKAFVVVKEGRSINSNDLKQFVEERVAAYKRIGDVMFVDSLPRNPSGKILRRVLKEKYA